MVDVSYIVPVFNALPYLEKTVESLLGQDYDPACIELLFIDDGSTDGSGAFLDELAKGYPQMRVYHIPGSGGPSAPRNVGLDHAMGEYVFFCDADDWMEHDATARMVRHAREWGSDVLLVKPKGENGRRIASGAFSRSMPKADVYTSDVCQALGPCKLFRRGFVEEQGLRFIWDWPVWEDQPFSALGYLEADTVSVAADGIYCHWFKRDDSESATDSRASVSFDVVFEYIAQMLRIFDERNARDRAREKFAQRILREGLFYAGIALHREHDETAAKHQFDLLRETVSPYISESFYRMCSVQRCLMYKAFCEGDRETWEAICVEERASERFSPERFEVDEAAETIVAQWPKKQGSVRVDARGRCPLNPKLVEIARGKNAFEIKIEVGKRPLFGYEEARLRLGKRNRGEHIDVPVSVDLSSGDDAMALVSVPYRAFAENGRSSYWDASLVVSFSNGREKRERIRVEGDVRGSSLDVGVNAPLSTGSVLLAPYVTKGGALSVMDCLFGASLEVESKLFGSSVSLNGVPKRAFEVLGSIELEFRHGDKAHVVAFRDKGPVEVRFRASAYSVDGVSR